MMMMVVVVMMMRSNTSSLGMTDTQATRLKRVKMAPSTTFSDRWSLMAYSRGGVWRFK